MMRNVKDDELKSTEVNFEHVRSITINQIENISTTITNLRTGDFLVLDIDNILLMTGLKKDEDTYFFIEPALVEQLRVIRERGGIQIIGFTTQSEDDKFRAMNYLRKMAITLDDIIHVPSETIEENKQLQKGKLLKKYLSGLANKPTRIIVIDNNIGELENIKLYAENYKTHWLLYQYLRPQHQNIQTLQHQIAQEFFQETMKNPIDKNGQKLDDKSFFPPHLKGFIKVKSLGDKTTNIFLIHNPKTKQNLIIKHSNNPDVIKLEILCNVIYQSLGVPVPRVEAYNRLPNKLARNLNLTSPYGIFQVSEHIEHDQYNLTEEKLRELVSQHFIAHVLLGNVNVTRKDNFIGPFLINTSTNFLIDEVDGNYKEDPTLLSELYTLRDETTNLVGHDWFSHLSDNEIKSQIKNCITKQENFEKVIWEVSSQLLMSEHLRYQFLQYISDRFDALVTSYCPEEKLFAKTDKKSQEGKTAAGILTYQIVNGIPYVLLGKRDDYQMWDNFGGKSDANETYLYETAQREVAEESTRTINYQHLDLFHNPSHDLITEKNKSMHIYRMYIVQHSGVIDILKLKDEEHTEYQWVRVDEILQGLQSKIAKVYDENTVSVQLADGNTITLYPPFYEMLQQQPVRENLQRLAEGKKLLNRHTQGKAGQYEFKKGRAIQSPVKIREQISETILNHADLIREFKRKNKQPQEIISTTSQSLSQSEVHLKALLGTNYQYNNVDENVRFFIKKYLRNKYYVDRLEDRIINQFVRFIEEEKRNKEKYFYFYHACDSKVGFAYTIYTKLYETLRKEDNWSAFRASQHYFENFPTINEFIAHYSNNGAKDIDNNQENFNECALSTNVFLFGNYGSPSSSSIEYLMTNSSRREINLLDLLKKIFQPFSLSDNDYELLLTLYKQAEELGGCLYQIGLPKEQLPDISYPAGSLGVMNEYANTRNLLTIMMQLEQDVETPQIFEQTLQYIENLQARIILPPSQRVMVSKMTEKEGNGIDQKLLDKTIRGIVFRILQNLSTVNETMLDRTSLFNSLKSTYLINGIPLAVADATTLTKAIIDNNEALLRNILTANPKMKQSKLSLKLSYIDTKNSELDKAMPLLDLILLHTTFSSEFIAEIFGRDWWEKTKIERKGKDFQFIKKIYDRILKEDRTSFLICYQDMIDNVDDFCFFLGHIPENSRLEYSKKHQHLINNTSDLTSILRLLGVNDETRHYAMAYEDKINNGEILSIFLNLLPENERLAFAKKYQSTIRDGKELVQVVEKLDMNSHFDFIMECQEVIRFGDEIPAVLSMLEKDIRIYFLSDHELKITNAKVLGEILYHLPKEEQFPLAKRHQRLIDQHSIRSFIEELQEDDRLSFLKHYRDNVTYENIPHVLALIPQKERFDFVSMVLKDIVIQYNFISIYNLLDEDHRLSLLYQTKHLIDLNILDKYTANLSEHDKLKFFMVHRKQIQKPNHIEILWNNLSETQKSTFIKEHQDNIQTFNDFIFCLYAFPENKRFNLAKKYQDKISNANELVLTLHKLSDREQIIFAKECEHLIKNFSDLEVVLTSLNGTNNDRPEFLYTHQDKINDGFDLSFSLTILPENARLAFANNYQHKINTSKELRYVLNELPQNDRLPFLMKNKDKIDEKHIGHFIYLLPPNLHLIFTKEIRSKITSFETTLLLIKQLRVEDRFEFAVGMLRTINCNKEEIEAITAHLPEDSKEKMNLSSQIKERSETNMRFFKEISISDDSNINESNANATENNNGLKK